MGFKCCAQLFNRALLRDAQVTKHCRTGFQTLSAQLEKNQLLLVRLSPEHPWCWVRSELRTVKIPWTSAILPHFQIFWNLETPFFCFGFLFLSYRTLWPNTSWSAVATTTTPSSFFLASYSQNFHIQTVTKFSGSKFSSKGTSYLRAARWQQVSLCMET